MEEAELCRQVEEYASLFLTTEEIAALCGLETGTLRREIRQGTSDVAKAYRKGKLTSMLEIRRLTVEFAKKGSPQAEMLCREYLEKMESDE